ncbi:cytochrome P450 [Nemania serpens]|nr:cytochrome P450 [Nemania serpens]
MTALVEITIVAAPRILGVAATIALLITFLNLIRRLCSTASLPSILPWAGIGEHNNRLGRAKANLASVFHLRRLLDEGYEKYSKNDQVFVLPYFINGPQVVLPPSQIPWLVAQSEDVLSQEHVNRQFLESDYSFFQANRVRDPVHPEITQHQLTRRIGGFVDDIVDEARASIDEYWGTDTEQWREVRVYDTVLLVIARMTLRVLAGLPLCRDKTFLSICCNFIRKVALNAAAISLFPQFIKPVVGPIFSLFDYILYLRCRTFIMPIIRGRLDQLRSQDTEKLPLEDPARNVDPRDDYVQWAIDHALAKPVVNPVELDPGVIAARFSVLAFAAIHSSAITLTNLLFDLAASRDRATSLASMREEVVRETGIAGWSKPAIGRMARVDSALRESLRLNGFIERGIMKMVVAPGGVTLPDGSRIPCGTKVGVSAYCVHHDEVNYPDAMRFDALRFVRDQEGEGAQKKRRQRLIDTSETFLGFSHGPRACPGRFFAANQLKIALGHIALLYDIETIPERPVNRWFFGHIAPPLTNILRVRRRKIEN